jgi:hypothetical protein
MPAWIDPNKLEVRDMRVFKYHVLEGNTLKETAEILNTSIDTIKRIKKKPAFRDMAIEEMNDLGYSIRKHMDKLIKKTDAQKPFYFNQELIYVDDNPSQMKALDTITDVYGLRAPKQMELSGSTSSSDAELFAEIEEAAENTGLVQESGEQSDSPEDSGDVEGTVL